MPQKKKDKKAKKAVTPEPEFFIQFSEEEEADELDLLADLDEDFFGKATKIVQRLMEHNRLYEASKLKKYVDILFQLHRKYSEEVEENNMLRPQVVRAETKLRFALELTASSEEAMQRLKEALENAWKESDVSLLREQDIQEKLQEILLKCENLESKETETQDDSAEFGPLAKYKNIILRERDRLNAEVNDLEKRLQLQRFYSESLEYINKNNEENITKMAGRVRVLDTEKQNLDVKIQNLMSNLDDQRDVNAKMSNKLDSANRELVDTNAKLVKKGNEYDRQKFLYEKLRGEHLLANRQLVKYEDEIADLRKEQKDNEETIRSLRLEDKVKANTITQLNNKNKKTLQDHNAISSKLYKLNRHNHTLSEDLMRLKNQNNALEKDLLTSAQKFEDLRRLKESIQHEREGLRSDIVKLNNTISGLRHTIMMQTNTIDNLHLDINKLNVKLDEAKINISKAEKERDEMAQEVETLHERIEYYQEQIQLKSDQVTDLTEKLQQKHFALINVKKQLEAVHSEKMVLQRSLETCTQERDNFRTLQTKTNHQISQLTNEISANQNRINSLNLHIDHLNNDKKELQSELRNKENVLSSVRKDLKDMKSKNESLLKTIAEDERKLLKISHELDETRKEKNLIGLQMVRRNDEIALLKEKMIITQTALDQGTTQYNQRLEDIRLLKIEISNLQTERECLSRAIKSTADMRREIIRLQRLLNQERIKVRSLTEDAKTPTGLHRWRILKCEDPTKYQLLEKTQALQKRNLRQQVDIGNLQMKLSQSSKMVATLKNVVMDLPQTDLKEKLVKAQRVSRIQERKLKARVAELNISEIELKIRECIIDELKVRVDEIHDKMDSAIEKGVVCVCKPLEPVVQVDAAVEPIPLDYTLSTVAVKYEDDIPSIPDDSECCTPEDGAQFAAACMSVE